VGGREEKCSECLNGENLEEKKEKKRRPVEVKGKAQETARGGSPCKGWGQGVMRREKGGRRRRRRRVP